MINIKTMKDILNSIDNVKSRAKKAIDENNANQVEVLMGDLYALEALLVYESNKVVKEVETMISDIKSAA